MNPLVRNAFDSLIKDPKVREEMLASIELVNRAASAPTTIARADGGSSVDPSAPNPVADNTAGEASTPTVDPEVVDAIVEALVASPKFADAIVKVMGDMNAPAADAPVMNSIDISALVVAAIKPLSDKLDTIERGLLSADEAAIMEAAGSAKITASNLVTRAKKIDPAQSPAAASLSDRAAAQMARMAPAAAK